MSDDLLYSIDKLSKDEAIKLQAKLLGYRKLPPSIEEFIESDYYLGRVFGNKKLYPYWKEKLLQIYPTPIHTDYPYVILTGPLGGGKSTLSKIMAAYNMCRLDHLDNFDYFGIAITKTLDFLWFHSSSTKAYHDFIASSWTIMKQSPYFETGMFHDYYSTFSYVADGPRSNNAIGGDIIYANFSEVNFIEYWKIKFKVDQLFSRFESRFLKVLGYFGGITIDSSATNENSYVNDLIKNSSRKFLVIEDPIWKIKSHLGIYFKTGSFKVYSGDNQTFPFIVERSEDITDKLDIDKFIEVPNELLDQYKTDIVLALQDTAGVSVSSTNLFYANKDKLRESFTLNFVGEPVIIVDFYNEDTYWDLVREYILNNVPDEKIIFIGIDMGVTGDFCGFSISYFDDYVYLNGKAIKEKIKIKTPVAFGIARIAGQETAITKIYDLIVEIENHYDIGAVVTDQYQSTQLRQDLNRKNIHAYLNSVDRDTVAYIYHKNQIYNGLSTMTKNPLLMKEAESVIDIGGKVDHNPGESKDILDSVVNSHRAVYMNIELATQISSKYSVKYQLDFMKRLQGPNKEVDSFLNSRTF